MECPSISSFRIQISSPEETCGIDCVLSTETQQFTYRIARGLAKYVSSGDSHDPKYDAWGESKSLTKSCNNVTTSGHREYFSNSSASHTLRLYPSDEFVQNYSTQNPIISTAGAVLVVLLTSLAFLVYDALVRKEFHDKQAVLDAKRQFMRFGKLKVHLSM